MAGGQARSTRPAVAAGTGRPGAVGAVVSATGLVWHGWLPVSTVLPEPGTARNCQEYACWESTSFSTPNEDASRYSLPGW